MANEYHPIKTIQLTKAKSTSLNIGGETSSSNAMKDRTKCQSTHCERQNILNSSDIGSQAFLIFMSLVAGLIFSNVILPPRKTL